VFWSATSECGFITLDFDPDDFEGIHVTMLLFDFPVPLDDLITAPGTYEAGVGSPTTFLLEPVARPGVTPVPSSIEVLVIPTCDTTTTLPAPTTTDPTSPSTLPFTGVDAGTMAGGAALLVLGGLVLLASLRKEETTVDLD
jgi:hypothetical protein